VVCALLFDDVEQVYFKSCPCSFSVPFAFAGRLLLLLLLLLCAPFFCSDTLTLALQLTRPPTYSAEHSYVQPQDFLPYARTEMVIDSQEHTHKRRIVFRIPRDLSRQMMILVMTNPHINSDTHMHRNIHLHPIQRSAN
jgi:hypothetical protein